jgi:hypothetical protein
MESAIWLVIYIVLGVALVLGGFWVIAKASLPQWVNWLFGGIVLVIILFALVYLAQHQSSYPPVIVR